MNYKGWTVNSVEGEILYDLLQVAQEILLILREFQAKQSETEEITEESLQDEEYIGLTEESEIEEAQEEIQTAEEDIIADEVQETPTIEETLAAEVTPIAETETAELKAENIQPLKKPAQQKKAAKKKTAMKSAKKSAKKKG